MPRRSTRTGKPARRPGANPYRAARLAPLKGELHLHTLHSDGRATPRAMLEACRRAGYDFAALTDHNTTSGLPEARAAAEGLVLLPGFELTTFRGHAVCLGLERVPEWRDLERRGIEALVHEVHQRGGLFCVSHPITLGSPVCSGCAWEWPITPGLVDLWELFSGPDPSRPNPELAELAWRGLLAAGGRAAPVAAGDVHAASAAEAPRAATFVYTAGRSPAGILEALRAGRLFASRGPRLDFWLEGAQGPLLVGEAAPRRADWRPRFALADGPAHPDVRLIGLRLSAEGRRARALEQADLAWDAPVPEGVGCLYAVARGADRSLLAVTAPIWTRN